MYTLGMADTPKNLPADFPVTDTPAVRVNIRKALAGLYLLQGRGSVNRCLIDAGYSRATARLQRQAGLSGESCIAEAAKLDASANPAKMLEVGRARAMLAIESCDPKTVALKDAMKMLDTIEKYYGGHQVQPTATALSVADRLSQIVALLVVARERGLPVPELPAGFIDAKVVKSNNNDAAASAVSVDGTTTYNDSVR